MYFWQLLSIFQDFIPEGTSSQEMSHEHVIHSFRQLWMCSCRSFGVNVQAGIDVLKPKSAHQ